MNRPNFRDNPQAHLRTPRQAWDHGHYNPFDTTPIPKGTDWQDVLVMVGCAFALGIVLGMVIGGVL